ncbi:MAG: hypothetical protein M1827_005438 [Pycnora praestabilis]|nr:MAG: hypothetical protein M1827_005438 [Pycnora praestabilis]
MVVNPNITFETILGTVYFAPKPLSTSRRFVAKVKSPFCCPARKRFAKSKSQKEDKERDQRKKLAKESRKERQRQEQVEEKEKGEQQQQQERAIPHSFKSLPSSPFKRLAPLIESKENKPLPLTPLERADQHNLMDDDINAAAVVEDEDKREEERSVRPFSWQAKYCQEQEASASAVIEERCHVIPARLLDTERLNYALGYDTETTPFNNTSASFKPNATDTNPASSGGRTPRPFSWMPEYYYQQEYQGSNTAFPNLHSHLHSDVHVQSERGESVMMDGDVDVSNEHTIIEVENETWGTLHFSSRGEYHTNLPPSPPVPLSTASPKPPPLFPTIIKPSEFTLPDIFNLSTDTTERCAHDIVQAYHHDIQRFPILAYGTWGTGTGDHDPDVHGANAATRARSDSERWVKGIGGVDAR